MKKRIILALALILTLAACGGNTAATGGDVPNGEVTVTPPQTQEPTPSDEPSPAEPILPDPSQEPDASAPVPPPASPAPAADISELIFSADTMGLSAEKNADDTITYTYADTSIKPTYTSNTEVIYGITVYGATAESNPITSTNINLRGQLQSDGTYLIDMTSLSGSDDVTGDSPIVVIDDNGLTATWESGAYEDGGLEKLGAFFVSIGLRVGGESVYSEQVEFGMDILK